MVNQDFRIFGCDWSFFGMIITSIAMNFDEKIIVDMLLLQLRTPKRTQTYKIILYYRSGPHINNFLVLDLDCRF